MGVIYFVFAFCSSRELLKSLKSVRPSSAMDMHTVPARRPRMFFILRSNLVWAQLQRRPTSQKFIAVGESTRPPDTHAITVVLLPATRGFSSPARLLFGEEQVVLHAQGTLPPSLCPCRLFRRTPSLISELSSPRKPAHPGVEETPEQKTRAPSEQHSSDPRPITAVLIATARLALAFRACIPRFVARRNNNQGAALAQLFFPGGILPIEPAGVAAAYTSTDRDPLEPGAYIPQGQAKARTLCPTPIQLAPRRAEGQGCPMTTKTAVAAAVAATGASAAAVAVIAGATKTATATTTGLVAAVPMATCRRGLDITPPVPCRLLPSRKAHTLLPSPRRERPAPST